MAGALLHARHALLPSQFLIVLAVHALTAVLVPCFSYSLACVECGTRADWKNCQVTPQQEEQRTNDFKALFKPYDIMQS